MQPAACGFPRCGHLGGCSPDCCEAIKAVNRLHALNFPNLKPASSLGCVGTLPVPSTNTDLSDSSELKDTLSDILRSGRGKIGTITLSPHAAITQPKYKFRPGKSDTFPITGLPQRQCKMHFSLSLQLWGAGVKSRSVHATGMPCSAWRKTSTRTIRVSFATETASARDPRLSAIGAA